MKLQRLGNKNAVVLETDSKEILISYSTPVEYRDKYTGQYFVTHRWYSTTTTRHINAWIPAERRPYAASVPQGELDSLVP